MNTKKNLKQDEWLKRFEDDQDGIILDVRTLSEINQGVIGNPVHADFFEGDTFTEKLEQLDKTKNYYVYCRSGARSGKACDIMDQMGFNNVYNLVGGISEWEGSINPFYD